MNTLFLVQFACCIIVSMLGLILVLSRFQIRWTNRRYEVSRWLLAFSMFVLAWHYVLQIVCGFRAKGEQGPPDALHHGCQWQEPEGTDH
jgi:hypothetical protein